MASNRLSPPARARAAIARRAAEALHDPPVLTWHQRAVHELLGELRALFSEVGRIVVFDHVAELAGVRRGTVKRIGSYAGAIIATLFATPFFLFEAGALWFISPRHVDLDGAARRRAGRAQLAVLALD
ncbi:MAG: hypothetical protein ACOC46_04275 [Pirellulales bacterium]